MNNRFLLLVLLLSGSSTNGSESIATVKILPGYPGTLPFNLETGYVNVGIKDEVQLFYYFIESERDPNMDPLILWLTGGPGCTGLSGLLYEIGPLAFDVSTFDGGFPSLILNPYSWTKMANIIFIDSPAGTGFSYANTSEGYATSDTKTAKDIFIFMRKWLLNHPSFIKNPLYIVGDSYGGKIVPIVTLEIAEGNEAGLEPRMTLQGYITGNAFTDVKKDTNEMVPYAHRMGLISDNYFELAKSSCDGEYMDPDPNNYQCLYALQPINECIKLINPEHILEPLCTVNSPRPGDSGFGQLFPQDDVPVNFLLLSNQEEPHCPRYMFLIISVWVNNEAVQEALHVRKGTVTEFKRCNHTVKSNYEYDVQSVFRHHQLLSDKGYQVLAYSGDHDLYVPYTSTLKWIHDLNLTVDDEWRPWTVDGQVAGYTEKYRNDEAYITFATVKGAGHVAPEYNPKQCQAMVKRWLARQQL